MTMITDVTGNNEKYEYTSKQCDDDKGEFLLKDFYFYPKSNLFLISMSSELISTEP